MLATLRAFIGDESGATANEYAVIAAGISITIIAAVNGVGTALNTKFTSVSSQLKYQPRSPHPFPATWRCWPDC
jgi:pilus assembly protein Flp/PilA